MAGNGQLSVPPGFRFHPTEEELLYYYLRKKVSYESIDLDVIREVDLNKLEPWDLKDKCRIGSGPQDEWYFFSHKDKKYPTGTRTNRATTAGFWKATGRDKAIHLSDSKRIGMRKTLVFYTGRAPHGQKTDWIMHEYRLDDDHHNADIQEDGWVVCRVFRKKNHSRGFQVQVGQEEHLAPTVGSGWAALEPKQQNIPAPYTNEVQPYWEGFKHLPQLSSPDSSAVNVNVNINHPSFLSPFSFNSMEMECSQNLLRLTTGGLVHPERFNSDWSFLDKLLASHQGLPEHGKCQPSSSAAMPPSSSAQRFPFHYHGYETDLFKFSK